MKVKNEAKHAPGPLAKMLDCLIRFEGSCRPNITEADALEYNAARDYLNEALAQAPVAVYDAAPDLLEAAKQAEWYIHEACEAHGAVDCLPYLDLLRAAIAKAEG